MRFVARLELSFQVESRRDVVYAELTHESFFHAVWQVDLERILALAKLDRAALGELDNRHFCVDQRLSEALYSLRLLELVGVHGWLELRALEASDAHRQASRIEGLLEVNFNLTEYRLTDLKRRLLTFNDNGHASSLDRLQVRAQDCRRFLARLLVVELHAQIVSDDAGGHRSRATYSTRDRS